jgi:hypothetical protein
MKSAKVTAKMIAAVLIIGTSMIPVKTVSVAEVYDLVILNGRLV